nr:hypothetical protein [Caballeronia udeis]
MNEMFERCIACTGCEQHEDAKGWRRFDCFDRDERFQREAAAIMLARLRRLPQRLLQVGDELQGAGVVGTLREYALEAIQRELQTVQAGIGEAKLRVNRDVFLPFVHAFSQQRDCILEPAGADKNLREALAHSPMTWVNAQSLLIERFGFVEPACAVVRECFIDQGNYRYSRTRRVARHVASLQGKERAGGESRAWRNEVEFSSSESFYRATRPKYA